jgi:hypothetical protein
MFGGPELFTGPLSSGITEVSGPAWEPEQRANSLDMSEELGCPSEVSPVFRGPTLFLGHAEEHSETKLVDIAQRP